MFKKSDWKPLILGCIAGAILFFGATVEADEIAEQFEPVDVEELVVFQTLMGPVSFSEIEAKAFILGARTGYLNAQEFVLDVCWTTEGNVLIIHINDAKYRLECRAEMKR